MSIRAKQKAKDLVVIRTGNPMETSWVLNYLNNAKRIPEKARPVISVKDMKGDEIRMPEPPQMPKMELKPQQQMPIMIQPPSVPPETTGGKVASGQIVQIAPDSHCGGSVLVRQMQNTGSQLVSEPLKPGPTINLVPDPSVQKIAEGIAIGKAAGAVQKMVEEKK